MSGAASPNRPGLRSFGPPNSRPASPSNRAEHRPYPADISPTLADRTLKWQVQRVKYTNITTPHQAIFAPCSAERMSTRHLPLATGHSLNLNLGNFWSQKVIFGNLDLAPTKELSAASRKCGESAKLKMFFLFRLHLLQTVHAKPLLRFCSKTHSWTHAWRAARSTWRFCYIFPSPLTLVMPAADESMRMCCSQA